MHQIRAASLYSYLDVARSVGIDGLKLLAREGIKPSSLTDAEARFPAVAATRVLENSAAEARCDSFGLRMAERRSFASLGPISLLLERLQDIGEVLETLGSSGRAFSDVVLLAVERREGVAFTRFNLIAPFDQNQATDLIVGMGYLALSGASHGRWKPEAVHFMHDVPRDRIAFERFFNAPIDFNSDYNGFSFAAEALRIPLPLADPEMADNARRLLRAAALPPAAAPLSDHVRHSIGLLLPEGRATLGEVARNLNLTSRALQRQLQFDGLTFAGLLNEVRRDLSRRHLRASDQNLTEIAQSLGYSDQSSFSRWFDREFGSSPSAWRKAHRSAAANPSSNGLS